VEQKGRTTYGEVADELVAEILGGSEGDQSYDEKNIRRRVYDALNVLLAMDMIAKDKKEIRWIGLPNNTQVLLSHNIWIFLTACHAVAHNVFYLFLGWS